jgi:hypothetical protein
VKEIWITTNIRAWMRLPLSYKECPTKSVETVEQASKYEAFKNGKRSSFHGVALWLATLPSALCPADN